MSFLDDQATGQIGIGEKASLSTLTRRRRKRKRGQAPTGAETYSLLPQDEFSNLVSSPTDIQRVGIGNLLQAQGTAAGDVPNVFDEYVSAAPRGTTLEAIYYQPPDDDDDPGDDDDLPSIEDDPYVPDPSSNVLDPATQTGQDYAAAAKTAEGYATPLGSGKTAFTTPMTFSEFARGAIQDLTGSAGKLGEALEEQDFGAYAKAQGLDTTDPKGTITQNVEAIGADDVAASGVSDPADAAGDGEGYGVGGSGYSGGASSAGGWTPFASGGTVKSKNKNSFMSMKGK